MQQIGIMQKMLSLLFAAIGWFAVITQYVLMMENRTAGIGETTIRFFSFFTILTNTLVAIYFTMQLFRQKKATTSPHTGGMLTAITVYITIVGVVYQVMLRHIWSPTGMQKLVDELLHSVIPLLVIFYWYLYEQKQFVSYRQITKWLLYPLLYFAFILVRGNFSGFYPYPFIHVDELGMAKALTNACVLLLVFVVVSAALIAIGKFLHRKKTA